MQEEAALVEESQALGALVAGHLDPQRAPGVMAHQTLLQGKGVATLQTAVTLQRDKG